jgi:glycosyltransferase involved in cell wall biosynthesis
MNKRLKIVHIIPELDISVTGGIGKFVQTLLRCICKDTTENIVVTYKSNESDRKYLKNLGIPVFSRLVETKEEDGNALQVAEWLIKTLKQIKPDIVHTNAFWGDTLGRQAAFRASVPVIVTTEHNTNLDESARQREIKRRLAKVTDCVVCVSETVRKYSREVDDIPDDRLAVIYNGLIFKEYEFDYCCKNKRSSEFVYIGRLEPQKAPLRLIEAFAAVTSESDDCRLSIIGNGSLMEQCLDKVKRLGLSGHVKFLSYKQKPWNWVPKGSVFVLSSDFEGLGIAALEAMASGILCILPNIGAVTEIAQVGSEAIFYEVGNRDRLIDSMKFVLGITEEQRIQMIKAARTRVERDFDAYQMANKYLNLYQKLYLNKRAMQFR